MNRMVMEHKGYKACIMEAQRLTGEGIHPLPSGTPLPVFYADEFEKWPENWMKGPGIFLVPVHTNKGLWFNWRDNDENNTAIIPTVKGCNPITGLQTTGFHLEKYDTKCPKHNIDFIGNRFCTECNYEWPDRSYVSGSPSWWDGFRNDDGSVRQFFFTEEEMRDVATHLIGKENTVPAFGFAFYSPKVRRMIQTPTYRSSYNNVYYSGSTAPMPMKKSTGSLIGMDVTYDSNTAGGPICGLLDENGPCASEWDAPLAKMSSPRRLRKKERLMGLISESSRDFSIDEDVAREPTKEVSVGAGAKINQNLNPDPYPLDSWNDKPDAVMTIYFVFQEKFEELKAGGMRDLSGVKEGMLSNVPVG